MSQTQPEWIKKAAKELFDDAAERFPMNGDTSLESHLKDIERIKRGFAAIITRHADSDRLRKAAEMAVRDYERDNPMLAQNPEYACPWYQEMKAALSTPQQEGKDALSIAVKALQLIEHATNGKFGSGLGAYHENACQISTEALQQIGAKPLSESEVSK